MKIDLQKIKLGFLGFVLFLQAIAFISPSLVSANSLINPIDTTQPASSTLPIYQGVDGSIKDYLCTPTGQGTDLYDCLGRLYRFGISAGAVALVFFIVMAGYLYITGGEAAKGKAKGVILSALTGMGILLVSYTLLSFINPELVKIKMIQPPIFNALDLPKCEEVGFGVKCIISVGGGKGQVYSGGEVGQCTAANLQSCSWNVGEAITICKGESGGNTAADGKADPCGQVLDQTTGQTITGKVPITVGLFQMSPDLAGSNGVPECQGVLDYGSASSQADCMVPITRLKNGMPYCPLRKCKAPKGMTALNTCLNKLRDKQVNIASACSAWKKQCWNPWSTRTSLTTKTCQ